MTLLDPPRIADGTFTLKAQSLSDVLLDEYPERAVTLTAPQNAALARFEYDLDLTSTPFLRAGGAGRVVATYRDDETATGLLFEVEANEDGAVGETYTLDGERTGWVRSALSHHAGEAGAVDIARQSTLTIAQSKVVSELAAAGTDYVSSKTDESGSATVLVVYNEEVYRTYQLVLDKEGTVVTAEIFAPNKFDEDTWDPISQTAARRLIQRGAR